MIVRKICSCIAFVLPKIVRKIEWKIAWKSCHSENVSWKILPKILSKISLKSHRVGRRHITSISVNRSQIGRLDLEIFDAKYLENGTRWTYYGDFSIEFLHTQLAYICMSSFNFCDYWTSKTGPCFPGVTSTWPWFMRSPNMVVLICLWGCTPVSSR